MSVYQLWVEMPADDHPSEQDANGNYISPEIVIILSELNCEWPGAKAPTPHAGYIAPSTRVNGGKKVLFVHIETGIEDPLPVIESIIAAEGKDWEVLAMGPRYKRDLYEPELDEFGEPTGEIVEAAWDMPPDSRLEPYLNDVQVGGTPTRPARPAQLPQWAGGVVMEVPEA